MNRGRDSIAKGDQIRHGRKTTALLFHSEDRFDAADGAAAGGTSAVAGDGDGCVAFGAADVAAGGVVGDLQTFFASLAARNNGHGIGPLSSEYSVLEST